MKSLVELHQGTITAESTAGEGSTFTVSLPTDCIYPDALHKETHTESKPDTAQPGKADDGDDEGGTTAKAAATKEEERDTTTVITERQ